MSGIAVGCLLLGISLPPVLTSEIKPLLSFSACLADEFHCNNGLCLPPSYRCNGDDDCGDESDEQFCGTFQLLMDVSCLIRFQESSTLAHGIAACKSEEHLCPDGRCIQQSWVCDGESDCEDGSDESNCSELTHF